MGFGGCHLHLLEPGPGALAPEYAGTVTRARLLPCMGMLLPDILHRLVPELDQERMKPILEEVLSEENAYVAAHGGVLYPEVEQTLAALSARCPLFLVSNCQDGYIEAFFQAHGLGRYFTDYETPAARGCPRRTTSPWWRSGTA